MDSVSGLEPQSFADFAYRGGLKNPVIFILVIKKYFALVSFELFYHASIVLFCELKIKLIVFFTISF